MPLRKMFLYATLLLLLFGAPALHSSVWAQQNKDHPELTKALARIDAVSENFSSFEANFSQKRYLALLREYEAPETGVFYYTMDKNRDVQLRHEQRSPGVRILTIKGDSAVLHQPAIRQAQIYNLGTGNRRNMAEYLMTGLGQSSARLRDQFEISYAGSEAVNGEPCSVLDFVPKDKSVAASLRSITIWFKNSTGTPVQYKFLEPTRDYILVTFSGEKLNGKIPADKFDQALPKNTEIFRWIKGS